MGAPDWTRTTDGDSTDVTGLRDYIQSGHQPLAPTRRKKKKAVANKQDDGVSTDGTNGLEAILDTVGPYAASSGHGESDAHEDQTTASTFDPLDDGPGQPKAGDSKSTPTHFSNVSDFMPVSMDQLVKDQVKNHVNPPPAPSDPTRVAIADWFSKQKGRTYDKVHAKHRDNIIEHILNHKYPGSTPNWPAALRQTVWRAVVRSNFFWVNPDDGQATGRPQPVHRPNGAYESDFYLFVMCAAERLDRIGRDLPPEEYVKNVEGQIRLFLGKAEKWYKKELAHLAFLLMCDEAQSYDLTVQDLAQRVKMAFGRSNLRFEGCEMLVYKDDKGKTNGRRGRSAKLGQLDHAEAMWEDAKRAP